ncbi:1-deoxy-D-xylulose-5-phosphate reductoisomerase, partial [Sulfitobacter sp. M23905]
LDLTKIGRFDFTAPDDARWPALRLARDVMAAGGLMGAVFNAAKEVALDGFIDGRLRFTQMAEIVEEVLERRAEEAAQGRDDMTLELVAQADQLARKAAEAAIQKRAG